MLHIAVAFKGFKEKVSLLFTLLLSLFWSPPLIDGWIALHLILTFCSDGAFEHMVTHGASCPTFPKTYIQLNFPKLLSK